MSAERFCARCSKGLASMSRVGRKPVAIPSGVTASVEGQAVNVKGPKGTLALTLHGDVAAKVEGSEIRIDPLVDSKRARAMWGTYRSLLANAITGVTEGFEQRLEITAVWDRAAGQGKNLEVELGYSHDTVVPIPEVITTATPRPIEIVITVIDGPKGGMDAAQ